MTGAMVPLPPEKWYNFARVRHIQDGAIYARAEEFVVCENPVSMHVICELGRDVRKGEQFCEGALVNWQQPKPAVGCVQVCGVCRARWSQDVYLHFQDGWRI